MGKCLFLVFSFVVIASEKALCDSVLIRSELKSSFLSLIRDHPDRGKEFVEQNKFGLTELSDEDAEEILTRVVTEPELTDLAIDLLQTIPAWIKFVKGTRPLLYYASARRNFDLAHWVEKNFSQDDFFLDLGGMTYFESLLQRLPPGGSEALDLFERNLPGLLANPRLNGLPDSMLEEINRWLHANSYFGQFIFDVLGHPKTLDLIRAHYGKEYRDYLTQQNSSFEELNPCDLAFVSDEDRKKILDQTFKNHDQIAHYARASTVPYLLAFGPEPYRGGLPEFDHHGLFNATENFLIDLRTINDSDGDSPQRESWVIGRTKAPSADSIVYCWQVFFRFLTALNPAEKIAGEPQWNSWELVLILESFLHSLGEVDRLEIKLSKMYEKDRNDAFEATLSDCFKYFEGFVRDLAAQMAKDQEVETQLALEKGSILDTLETQFPTAGPFKTKVINELKSDLTKTNIFPARPPMTKEETTRRSVSFLQAASAKLHDRIQKNRPCPPN